MIPEKISDFKYTVGGCVQSNHFYIKRKADEELEKYLKDDDFCYVFNARQMGKSSLRIQISNKLKNEGILCCNINLIMSIQIKSPEEWYQEFLRNMLRSINVQIKNRIEWKSWWYSHKDLPVGLRFKMFIDDVLLAHIKEKKIVIFVDEIDSILSLPFSLDEFWRLIRFCYDLRAENSKYKRLTFAIFGVVTPYHLIQNKTQTPFDIGKAIDLTGFTAQQAQPLAEGLKKKARNHEAVLKEILNWTGGQPFLTQKLCYLFADSDDSIDDDSETKVVERLVKSKVIENWEIKDEPQHLRTIRDRLLHQDNEESLRSRLELYRKIQQGVDILASHDKEMKLQLSGLVIKDQQNKLKVYNPIYREIFNLDWVKKELEKLVRIDWGKAPNLSHFYGRSKELQDLEKWIINEQSKIVAIVGIGGIGKTELSLRLGKGGIGKTELSKKLAENIKGEFEYIVWRSLLNAPPLTEILSDIIEFLSKELRKNKIPPKKLNSLKSSQIIGTVLDHKFSNQSETNLPDFSKDKIGQLIDFLKKHRCLVILDNVESILKKGSDDEESNDSADVFLEPDLAARQYRDYYDDYGEFFNQIGTVQHQSCLIITSRVIPPEIDLLRTNDASVRLLVLEGLKDIKTVQAFFEQFGTFHGTEEIWSFLVKLYEGNPYALKLAALKINRKYNGDIYDFILHEKNKIFGSMKDLLDWHFNDLGYNERELIYWLAINREPVSESELLEDIISVSEEKQVHSIIESLNQKKFLLRTLDKVPKFSIIPVLIEYVTKKIIELSVHDIKNKKFNLLNRICLLKGKGKYFIKSIQARIILQPIIDNLKPSFDLLDELQNRIDSKLENNNELFRELNQYNDKIKALLKQFDIEELLNQALSMLRERTPKISGYAAGNILNLLIQNKIDKKNNQALKPILSKYNFSYLSIWQADLSRAFIHDVNFTKSQFKKCLFTDTFGVVLDVNFSPDGKFFASGDISEKIRIWEVKNNQLFSICEGHDDYILSISFSPDSQLIASSSIDKTAKIWDVKTGKLLNILEGHIGWVNSVVFSFDGEKLASCSSDGVKIWNVKDGKCLKNISAHTDGAFPINFTPDGKQLASFCRDKTIKIWDIKTGNLSHTLPGLDKSAGSLAFSPNGKLLACAFDEVYYKDNEDEEKVVKIWEHNQGKWQDLNTLAEINAGVRSISFSPDSKKLACCVCRYDHIHPCNPIRIYDVKTWEYQSFEEHSNWIMSGAFHPDGKIFVSSSEDETIKIWDIETGECLETMDGYTNWQLAVAFHPDGKILASGDNNATVYLWDVETGECLKTLKGHTSSIWSLAFSSDGKILASGSTDLTIRLWDIETGECQRTLLGKEERIWSLAFNPDDTKLASSSVNQKIRIWDLQTNHCQILDSNESSGGGIKSITYSSDGVFLISASEDRTIRIWNIHTSECLNVLKGHKDWVTSVDFIDHQKLASASEDKTIRIWNVYTSECLNVLKGHTGGISSLCISSDGQKLVSGGRDKTLLLWNLSTHEYKTLKGHKERVDSVVFSPSGKTIASSGRDGTIRLWDAETGKHNITLRIPRPYEGMKITSVEGLNTAQKKKLKILGAIDDSE